MLLYPLQHSVAQWHPRLTLVQWAYSVGLRNTFSKVLVPTNHAKDSCSHPARHFIIDKVVLILVISLVQEVLGEEEFHLARSLKQALASAHEPA